MASVHDQFVGVADESTYATGVAPTDFFEVVSEDVSGTYERIESEAIRGPVLRADRFAPNPKGASGSFEFEVLDKGLEFWLPHMLGAVDDTTVPGTHTATLGELNGRSLSYQAARYASGDDSLVPFSYHGGKVTEWSLSAEVDAIVKANVSLDFATEVIDGTGADALATPTYPADAQLLTFIGGSVTVGGSAFAVSSVTVSGSNGLKVDRYSMRGAESTTKREPKAEEMREVNFELTGEFEDTSNSDRIAAELAAGALAEIVLNFDSPQGGALSVTLPAARFDEGAVNISRAVIEQGISGKALQPTAGETITVDYLPVV
jgi:hypothetical protein